MFVCVFVVIEQSARDRSITKKYFPQLRDWISRFLDSNKDMTASLIGHNMLVEQVPVASSSSSCSVNINDSNVEENYVYSKVEFCMPPPRRLTI